LGAEPFPALPRGLWTGHTVSGMASVPDAALATSWQQQLQAEGALISEQADVSIVLMPGAVSGEAWNEAVALLAQAGR